MDPEVVTLALEPVFLSDYGSVVQDILDNKPVFEQCVHKLIQSDTA